MDWEYANLSFQNHINTPSHTLDNGRTLVLLQSNSPIQWSLSTIQDDFVPDETQQQSRPQRCMISDQEWERIRLVFTELYQSNRHRLKDIMQIMGNEHDFHATISMYKKRIHDWGLSKSFTSEEKADFSALAKEYIRKGQKLPTHDAQGRVIPWNRVRRQEGRKIIPVKLLRDNKRHNTPSIRTTDVQNKPSSGAHQSSIDAMDMSHATSVTVTPLSILSSPTDTWRVECMFYYTTEYYSWYSCTNKTLTAFDKSDAMLHCYKSASGMLRYGSPEAARGQLSLVRKSTVEALQQPSVTLLLDMLIGVAHVNDVGDFATKSLLMHFLVQSSLEILGARHPIYIVLSQLLEVMKSCPPDEQEQKYNPQLEGLLQCCFERLQKIRKTKLALSANEDFWIQSDYVEALAAHNWLQAAETSCEDLILWSIGVYGTEDSRSMRAKLLLAHIYCKQSRKEEVLDLIYELWERWQVLREESPQLWPSLMEWLPVGELGAIYRLWNDSVRSANCYYQAFQINLDFHGHESPFTICDLDCLLDVLEQDGKVEMANRLKREYPTIWTQTKNFAEQCNEDDDSIPMEIEVTELGRL